MKKRRHCLWVLGGAAVVFGVSSCAGWTRSGTDPLSPEALEARALIHRLKRKNQALKTFKGLGTLRLKKGGKQQTLRVAWMGQTPEKLRLEALAVSGQPLASLSGDGQWLYFLDHADGRYYKKPYDKGLARFLSMPVNPKRMLALLGGKIPVLEHHEAVLTKASAPPGYLLVLKKRWQGVVQKIYLDGKKERVLRIEYFDSRGRPVFHVHRDRFRAVSGFDLPFFIRAFDADAVFELAVKRCWTNVPVDPEGFVIHPQPG